MLKQCDKCDFEIEGVLVTAFPENAVFFNGVCRRCGAKLLDKPCADKIEIIQILENSIDKPNKMW